MVRSQRDPWCLDRLVIDFERTGIAIWKHYGNNIFVQMPMPPNYLPENVLKRHIQVFTLGEN